MINSIQSNFVKIVGIMFLTTSLASLAGEKASGADANCSANKTYVAASKEVKEGDIKTKYAERTYSGDGLPVLALSKVPQHKVRSDELLMMRAFHLISVGDEDGFIALYAPSEREKIRAYYKANPKAWGEGVAAIKGADKVLIKHVFGMGRFFLVESVFMSAGKEVGHLVIPMVTDRKIYFLTQEAKGHRLYADVLKKYELKDVLLPIE